MSVSSIISVVAQSDAAIFLAGAVLLAGASLAFSRRPVTMARAMEVSLITLVFMMVGVRYAVMAAMIAIAPDAVFGTAVSPALAGFAAAAYAVVAAIGLLAHRGSVAWRVTGAVLFGAVTVVEAGANLVLLAAPITTRLDTVLSIVVAAATIVLAMFHWTRRAPAPNPLGGDARPFDY